MSSTLSAYELERAQNIRDNHATLLALGIEKLAPAPKAKPIKGAATNKREKKQQVAPRQRSLRQRNLDVDGSQLPETEVKPEPPVTETKRQRRSGPLDASKVTAGKTNEEDAVRFFEAVSPALAVEGKVAKGGRVSKKFATASLVDTLRAMTVADDDMAKLVPERIFSCAWHPSATKLLVAAGDTWGKIGLWDCDQPGGTEEEGGSPCVVTFETHSRPVAGLRVAPQRPSVLLSCSHDGCVRALDLGGSGSSDVLWSAPADADGDYATLHGLSESDASGCVYTACGDGTVVRIDPRDSSQQALGQLHDKKIFSATLSGGDPSLLATASLDRTVRVWDLRKVAPKPKPLCELEHGLSVTAAHWSAGGSALLSTCNDNTLRVFRPSRGWADASCTAAVSHNCKTGRFLTAFQAVWLPGSDDAMLCGSLEHPRGVDVYSATDGEHLIKMESEPQASVTSLHAFHPTTGALAAANSSGRVFLWR